MLDIEKIKSGFFLEKKENIFLVTKVNKKSFYLIEMNKKIDPIVFLEKLQTKSNKVSMKDFCNITGMFQENSLSEYTLSSKTPIISDKEIKKRKIGVSPCCGRSAAKIYSKRGVTGRCACTKCKKILNIVKPEPDRWLSFSQNYAFYLVNLDTLDMKLLRQMSLSKKC